MKRLLILFAPLSLLAACAEPAPPAAVSMIEFRDAWARASAAGQTSGAMYFTIVNQGGAEDRLIGVSAARAAMASVHATETLDGIARMRMVRALPVPANTAVALSPGGTHVMLSGMTTPLVVGERVELTLRFEKAGTKTVSVVVNAPAAR